VRGTRTCWHAALFCAMMFVTASLSAYEIQLREAIVAHAPLVRLADIAMITNLDDASRLALERLVIAPSPTPSGSRTVSATQLRYWLKQYGVETAECRMTGARRVVILGKRSALPGEPDAKFEKNGRPAGATSVRFDLNAVKRRVNQALLEQLHDQGVETTGWSIDVDLPRRALWTLPPNWNDIQVEGLHGEVAGDQKVTVRFASTEEVTRVPVTVRMQRSDPVIIAVHALAPGDLISRGDIESRPPESTRRLATAARDPRDVVGREVKRAIAAGQMIETTAVQMPLLVHRRDTVLVEARTGAIVVRRRATALQDGSLGDVIQFASLTRRNDRFMGQVTGRRTAAVFVSPPAIVAAHGPASDNSPNRGPTVSR